MKTFVTLCFLSLLLLVAQLRWSEAGSVRLRRAMRGTHHRHRPPLSHSAAEADFTRRDTEIKISSESCEDEDDSSQDIRNLSLSPWKNKICTDPSRYPPKIRMSECLRRDCNLPGSKDSSRKRGRLISIPLMYSMDVWYRHANGTTTKSSLDVTIGCTCVKEGRWGQ